MRSLKWRHGVDLTWLEGLARRKPKSRRSKLCVNEVDGSDRQYIGTGRWRFDAEGSWKGHDARLSVTFLMSAGRRRAGSQSSAHPDDSIRIQACSESRPRRSSPLRALSGWPLLAALPRRLSSPDPPNAIIDRRFHRRSPPRSLAWPLHAPRLGQDVESYGEFLPRGTKPFTNITNFPRIERRESSYRLLLGPRSFLPIFLFKSSSLCFERKFL